MVEPQALHLERLAEVLSVQVVEFGEKLRVPVPLRVVRVVSGDERHPDEKVPLPGGGTPQMLQYGGVADPGEAAVAGVVDRLAVADEVVDPAD